MRDKRFIAKHRGGLLAMDQHKLLIKWSYLCVEHVLSLLGQLIDSRILNAISVAKEWEKGNVKTGVAMKAAVEAHSLARESSNPVEIAIARAAGHAVATAHMADHSLGGALYALKAVKYAGRPIDIEKDWQNRKVPLELKDLVLETLMVKGKSFKL